MMGNDAVHTGAPGRVAGTVSVSIFCSMILGFVFSYSLPLQCSPCDAKFYKAVPYLVETQPAVLSKTSSRADPR